MWPAYTYKHILERLIANCKMHKIVKYVFFGFVICIRTVGKDYVKLYAKKNIYIN